MKRLTAILMALSLAFPAWAAAELDVNTEQKEENGQTLTVFSAAAAELSHALMVDGKLITVTPHSPAAALIPCWRSRACACAW